MQQESPSVRSGEIRASGAGRWKLRRQNSSVLSSSSSSFCFFFCFVPPPHPRRLGAHRREKNKAKKTINGSAYPPSRPRLRARREQQTPGRRPPTRRRCGQGRFNRLLSAAEGAQKGNSVTALSHFCRAPAPFKTSIARSWRSKRKRNCVACSRRDGDEPGQWKTGKLRRHQESYCVSQSHKQSFILRALL